MDRGWFGRDRTGVPDATVRAGDHPPAVHSAYFSVARSALRSIQLKRIPRANDDSGCALFCAAGVASSRMAADQCAGCGGGPPLPAISTIANEDAVSESRSADTARMITERVRPP